MFVMPAYSRGANSLGTKLVTLFPDNDKKGIPSHLAIILLLNASTGQLQAVRNYK
jgi:ornithine cyclodeaminase